MKLNYLVYNILSMTLVYILFLLFKGPTNIVNALFVPLTLFVFSYKNTLKERLIFYAAVVLFSALFFSVQVFFVLVYCFIAAILSFIEEKKIRKILAFFLLTTSVSLCFYVGLVLTDLFFRTHINAIMMKILDNQLLVYFSIILLEAGVVSIFLIGLSTMFVRRMRSR